MNRILILWLACFALLVSAAAQDRDLKATDADGTDRISRVKGALASTLDSSLPAIRLEDWLLQQVGTNAQFGWVLRYLPRKEGQPIHDFPDAVEADIMMQDGRSISVLVAFHAPKQRPYIYSVNIFSGKREMVELNRLGELTQFLR
jgi:hypothetical protein